MKQIRCYGTLFCVVTIVILLIGCGGPSPTVFIHQDYNFGFMERVAVIPFENITREQGAAERATRFFITELLAAEVFDVVEPGEVDRVLVKVGAFGSSSFTKKQLVDIGAELQVQALFLGSVNEATTIRSGASQSQVVTISVRLVETESGQTIWSTINSERGLGFWTSIFGGSGKSQSEVMRKCVHETLKTLID